MLDPVGGWRREVVNFAIVGGPNIVFEAKADTSGVTLVLLFCEL